MVEAGKTYLRGSRSRRRVLSIAGDTVTFEGLNIGNQSTCTVAEFTEWLGDDWCLVCPEMVAFGEGGFA